MADVDEKEKVVDEAELDGGQDAVEDPGDDYYAQYVSQADAEAMAVPIPEVDPVDFARVLVPGEEFGQLGAGVMSSAEELQERAEEVARQRAEICGRISRAYDNLADAGGNPFVESGDPGYAQWEFKMSQDVAFTMLEERIAADGGRGAEALERAKATAYDTGLHPVEVMAAATGMSVSEYANSVLGPQNVAEGPHVGGMQVMDALAEYHGEGTKLYEVHCDHNVDMQMASLAESAMGVGHNLRDGEARAEASEAVENFGISLVGNTSEWTDYDYKSDLANEAGRLYDGISVEDRMEWDDMIPEHRETAASMLLHEMGEPAIPHLPSLDERYAGYEESGNLRERNMPIGESIPGDDYASKLLRETLTADKQAHDASDPMAWFTGGSHQEAVAALRIAEGAAEHGVHPVEQAAFDADMSTSNYVRALVAERGMEGDDAERAYAAAMQSVASYHGIGAAQYAGYGYTLVERACSGVPEGELQNWSDEASYLDDGGILVGIGPDPQGLRGASNMSLSDAVRSEQAVEVAEEAPVEEQQQASWQDSIPARFVVSSLLGPGVMAAADVARVVSGMDNAEVAEAAHDGGKVIGSAMCGGAAGILLANATENLSNASDQLAADGGADVEGIALDDAGRVSGNQSDGASKEGASFC